MSISACLKSWETRCSIGIDLSLHETQTPVALRFKNCKHVNLLIDVIVLKQLHQKPKWCTVDHNLQFYSLPGKLSHMRWWKSKPVPLAGSFTNPSLQMMIKHDVFVICFICRLPSSAACVFQTSISQTPRYCSSSLSGYTACISRHCHSARWVLEKLWIICSLGVRGSGNWMCLVLRKCGWTVEGSVCTYKRSLTLGCIANITFHDVEESKV